MARNSYKKWSQKDIRDLDTMYQQNYSKGKIAKKLGRTKPAIESTLKKILIHQIIRTDISTVSKKYKVSKIGLYNSLVPPKYYVKSDTDHSTLYFMIGSLILANICIYNHNNA